MATKRRGWSEEEGSITLPLNTGRPMSNYHKLWDNRQVTETQQVMLSLPVSEPSVGFAAVAQMREGAPTWSEGEIAHSCRPWKDWRCMPSKSWDLASSPPWDDDIVLAKNQVRVNTMEIKDRVKNHFMFVGSTTDVMLLQSCLFNLVISIGSTS